MEHNLKSIKNLELLGVSFAYPPLAYANSIQVARLLTHVNADTVLICADEDHVRKDDTFGLGPEANSVKPIQVPFTTSRMRAIADKLAHHMQIPLWNRNPDRYLRWTQSAQKKIYEIMRSEGYTPDILLTFGQPMSDHLVGLSVKKTYNLPWVAHFSDPWTDNPLNKYDFLSRRLNLSLELSIIKTADRLIFTSQETLDLVMDKYPVSWKSKAMVLPHSFDPGSYPKLVQDNELPIIIRYVGNFYGKRNPKPLFKALRNLYVTHPDCLEGIRFELIGSINRMALKGWWDMGLPKEFVDVKLPVSYQESLRLMTNADGLIVIDAPADVSVFLPSKLIDYIGAGRPILGITPPGASAKVIQDIGGWTADPRDLNEMTEAFRSFLLFLRQRKNNNSAEWGDSGVRKRYEAVTVAKEYEKLLHEIVNTKICHS